MESHPSSSSRADRKTIEKNRRNYMKALCSKLNSLVPRAQSSKESLTLPDQLDEAAKYIKKLQVNVERMKEKKKTLMGFERSLRSMVAQKPPEIEVHGTGSALQIVFTTRCDQNFIFNAIVRVLHEEGTEIVNAAFCVVDDDTVFHTIHCKVEESVTGYTAASKLKKLIHDTYNGI